MLCGAMRGVQIPVAAALWAALAAPLVGPSGCGELAAADEPLATLDRIGGRVLDYMGDLGTDQQVRPVLSWYAVAPDSFGDRPWLVAETSVTEGPNRRFEIEVVRAPPVETRVTAELLEGTLEIPEDSWLALGFVGAVTLTETQDSLDWLQIFEDGLDAPAYAGGSDDGMLVAWWSADEPLEASKIGALGGQIEPGLNLLQIVQRQSKFPFAVHPLDTPYDIDPRSFWGVGLVSCLWVSDLPVVEVFPEDPGYPETFEGIQGSCDLCGRRLESTNCAQVLGMLCQTNCTTQQFYVDASQVGQSWPCAPAEGQACGDEGDEWCALDSLYRCQGGAWKRAEDCTLGADCCKSGCVAVE